MVFAPDKGLEAMLRMEMMSSDVEITAFLSWEFFPLRSTWMLLQYWGFTPLCRRDIHKYTWYCDKESASDGHFLYRTFLKLVAEYTPISQEGSNFRKKTAKKFILPPKFQKEIWNAQKVHEFLEYLWYHLTQYTVISHTSNATMSSSHTTQYPRYNGTTLSGLVDPPRSRCVAVCAHHVCSCFSSCMSVGLVFEWSVETREQEEEAPWRQEKRKAQAFKAALQFQQQGACGHLKGWLRPPPTQSASA